MNAAKPGDTATALVGDIGGTNARFALADLAGATPRITDIREYPSRTYASGGAAVGAYLKEVGAKPSIAVIAVAGPITHGAVHFTNLGWTFSETELLGLGFAKAHLLNDFEALALATRHLEPKDLYLVGKQCDGEPNATVAVIGPGTGFGASALVRGGGHAIALAAEGGHASFAPNDETEREILRVLSRKYQDQVSIERVLSGPGLQNLHAALNEIEGVPDDPCLPAEITQRALRGETRCARTVDRFCSILGSVAGDFALTYGARGGLFIAGGISPTVLPILEKSDFRTRFEAKGRFKSYLAAIPTQVILHTHAAFLGAGDLARKLSQ
ncbi:MAG TPA: glucokinase [Rhizomicrobium sp.]|nr:glucokinase [Rhizomicrobium sp.]